jgi:hypothetical protein
MDFEYKKYILLAYLKSCRESFEATRLYPPLGSLVKHYHDLTELNKSLEQLTLSFLENYPDLISINFDWNTNNKNRWMKTWQPSVKLLNLPFQP